MYFLFFLQLSNVKFISYLTSFIHFMNESSTKIPPAFTVRELQPEYLGEGGVQRRWCRESLPYGTVWL